MPHATFRFHDSLKFFLPRKQKNQPITHTFDWKASIKDMVESMGVPHPEVELLVVNGTSVGWDYIVQPDDEIDIHPQFDAISLTDKTPLFPVYSGKPRFILDTHLGRLAAYLRMMGFDTLYRNDYPDDELAQVSHDENRILLTRDVGLLKRSLVIYGYFVRHTKPRQRILEIAQRYNLAEFAEPFKYCMKCNGNLYQVEKQVIQHQLPGNTTDYYDIFHQCEDCERIFWKGSHYRKMADIVQDVMDTL